MDILDARSRRINAVPIQDEFEDAGAEVWLDATVWRIANGLTWFRAVRQRMAPQHTSEALASSTKASISMDRDAFGLAVLFPARHRVPTGLASPLHFRKRSLFLLLLLFLSACGAARQPAEVRAILVSPTRPDSTPSGTATASPSPPGNAPSTSGAPGFTRPTSGSVASLYVGQTHGYDISYPQCSAASAPPQARFAIVGVNHGKPFTTNPCISTEWSWGRQGQAVYVNSGYNAASYSRATPDCRSLSERLIAPDEYRRAYATGCSEALYVRGAMQSEGVGAPVMWWIDVERANSWDHDDLNLNRFALQGEIDQIAALGRPLGLYSNLMDWRIITGGWSPRGVVANWVTGTTPATDCGAPGFSGAPVWLVQERATWPQPWGYDSDWAC